MDLFPENIPFKSNTLHATQLFVFIKLRIVDYFIFSSFLNIRWSNKLDEGLYMIIHLSQIHMHLFFIVLVWRFRLNSDWHVSYYLVLANFMYIIGVAISRIIFMKYVVYMFILYFNSNFLSLVVEFHVHLILEITTCIR